MRRLSLIRNVVFSVFVILVHPIGNTTLLHECNYRVTASGRVEIRIDSDFLEGLGEAGLADRLRVLEWEILKREGLENVEGVLEWNYRIGTKSLGQWLEANDQGPAPSVKEPPAPEQARLFLPTSTGPLTGRKINVNPAHGWVWTGSSWAWQRPLLNGYREDTGTHYLVEPLVARLRAAGASVLVGRNENRGYGNSSINNKPSWENATLYWVQDLGLPSWIYNNGGDGDYNRDIRSRPRLGNWFQADIGISMHTNAGGGTGTLLIYSNTNSSANQSAQLSNAIMDGIMEVVRRDYDPTWNRFNIWASGGYGEANQADHPVALIELAFHDNLEKDNPYLQDPAFREASAQGIYQGVLEYFGVPYEPEPGPPVWEEQGSMVVCEAENYGYKATREGHSWNFYGGSYRPGWAGTGYMRAEPANGTVRSDDFVQKAPRMDYWVDFAAGGTFYVWVRVQNDGTGDDALHLGLNGSAQTSATAIRNTGATGQWVWTRALTAGGNAALMVPGAGAHTVNVWMCKDGARIDRFILTRDPGYVPTGTGPNETIWTGSTPTVPPTHTPTRTPTSTHTPSPTLTHTPAPPTATFTPTPIGPDFDGDGIADSLEGGMNAGLLGKSNMYLYDSDGDGLHDGIEDINRNGIRDPNETCPIVQDSDGDGYEDGIEVFLLASSPLDPNSPETPFVDTDGDLLPDSLDPDPNNPDTAGDRFLDGYKAVTLGLASITNPNMKPTLGDVDHNGVRDNADAQRTLNFFANIEQIGFDSSQSDVNRDAVIDNADAQRMLMFFARILGVYPGR